MRGPESGTHAAMGRRKTRSPPGSTRPIHRTPRDFLALPAKLAPRLADAIYGEKEASLARPNGVVLSVRLLGDRLLPEKHPEYPAIVARGRERGTRGNEAVADADVKRPVEKRPRPAPRARRRPDAPAVGPEACRGTEGAVFRVHG